MNDQPPKNLPEPGPKERQHYVTVHFEDGRTAIPAGDPIIAGLTMPQILIAGKLLCEIGMTAVRTHAAIVIEGMARKAAASGIAIAPPGSSFGRKRH